VKILGIETSCDETAASVVEDGKKVLGNCVASSLEMHAKTGGVIPENAARQQVVSIMPTISEALVKAGLDISEIDALAVTAGPGLIGSLLVGVETAKTLARIYKKPITPVNHLVAHIYANWLSDTSEPKFPALALVVSGGHSDLVLLKKHGSLSWLGGTRDDAAGEAFDKTARLLGLPYPGGPAISGQAAKFLKRNTRPLSLFPRPILDEKNYDWSFSGLKTAVARTIEKNKAKSKIPEFAAEIQEAIVDVLVEKTLRAAGEFKPKSLLLAGGVAANARLREKFRSDLATRRIKVDYRVPPPGLCTDNAAYIAAYAFYNPAPSPWQKVQAHPELTIVGQA
jgi:N6-L-threonylcarbamoyladenine synthase